MSFGGKVDVQTHGLRHVVVSARAMQYDTTLFSLSKPGELQPQGLDADSALEFRQMTRGIDVYVELPEICDPLHPDPNIRSATQVCVQKFLTVGQTIRAKGLVMPPLRRQSNGRFEPLIDLRPRLETFLGGLDFGDYTYTVSVLLPVSCEEPGPMNPFSLQEVLQNVDGPFYTYILDPETWDKPQLDWYSSEMRRFASLALVSDSLPEDYPIKELKKTSTVVLCMKSLAAQRKVLETLKIPE